MVALDGWRDAADSGAAMEDCAEEEPGGQGDPFGMGEVAGKFGD